MQVVKADEISKELERKMQELKSLIDTFKVRSSSNSYLIQLVLTAISSVWKRNSNGTSSRSKDIHSLT